MQIIITNLNVRSHLIRTFLNLNVDKKSYLIVSVFVHLPYGNHPAWSRRGVYIGYEREHACNVGFPLELLCVDEEERLFEDEVTIIQGEHPCIKCNPTSRRKRKEEDERILVTTLFFPGKF